MPPPFVMTLPLCCWTLRELESPVTPAVAFGGDKAPLPATPPPPFNVGDEVVIFPATYITGGEMIVVRPLLLPLLLLQLLEVFVDFKVVVKVLAQSTWSYEDNLLSFAISFVVVVVAVVVDVVIVEDLLAFWFGWFDTCKVFIDCIGVGVGVDDLDVDDRDNGGPGPLCWFKFIIITVGKREPARSILILTLPFYEET